MISLQSWLNVVVLLSLLGFIVSWNIRNFEVLSKQFSWETWLAIGVIWAAVVVFRNAVLPLELYRPVAHDAQTVQMIFSHTPLSAGNPTAGIARLYLILLFLGETLRGGGMIMREIYSDTSLWIRWPSLYDLLVGPFIVAFVAIGFRFNIRKPFSLIAAALILFQPASLFFSSVLTDHWLLGFVLAVAAFQITFEFQRLPFKPLPAVIVISTALAASFYAKYFGVFLLPVVALGIVGMKQPLKIKFWTGLGVCGVFCALCAFEFPILLPLFRNLLTPSGKIIDTVPWAHYTIFQVFSHFRAVPLYRFTYPLATIPFLLLVVVGFWQLCSKERRFFNPLLLFPFLAICLIIPFGFIHPGERFFLPLVFSCIPALARGIQFFAVGPFWKGQVESSPDASRASFVTHKARALFGFKSVRITGLIMRAAFLVAISVWSVQGALVLSRSIFDQPSNREFDELAARMDQVDREKFTEIVANYGRDNWLISMIGDVDINEVLDLKRLGADRVRTFALPCNLDAEVFRKTPTFLLLEKDAYQWTTRFRKDYRILIESKFRMEPIGLHTATRSLIFLLHHKSPLESIFNRTFTEPSMQPPDVEFRHPPRN